MERWPHQVRALAELLAAIDAGERRICLTSPTGGGKTTINRDLAMHFLEEGKRVVLYSTRRMMIDQLAGDLSLAGIDHGIRAAGHEPDGNPLFQISSIFTEASRNLEPGNLYPADLVLVDEAHLQTGLTAEKILAWHMDQDAVIVGSSATPIGLSHVYNRLVTAGTNSELRKCGAHVPAMHFGPDEPDMASIRKRKRKKGEGQVDPGEGEDLSEEQVRHAMGPRVSLIGRIWRHFEALNPDKGDGRKRTLVFAPGVDESVWVAQQFETRQVKAAHIDGEHVWVDGELARTTQDRRDDIVNRFKAGEIRVLCNRFVMREGIDIPEVEHLILATVFGSLQTYLQAGGRGVRACPAIGKTKLVVQDHGGNWWRHGSLNDDRAWDLTYSASTYAGMREDRFREKNPKDPEPCRCPNCSGIVARMIPGTACPHCGHVFDRRVKSRPVVTTDGTLRPLAGDIFRARQVDLRRDTAKLWTKAYFQAKNSGWMSFRQAIGLFLHTNYYEPPRNMKYMPAVDKSDWYRKVHEVPMERLFQESPKYEEKGHGPADG